jgi:hypothetical protein
LTRGAALEEEAPQHWHPPAQTFPNDFLGYVSSGHYLQRSGSGYLKKQIRFSNPATPTGDTENTEICHPHLYFYFQDGNSTQAAVPKYCRQSGSVYSVYT